MQTPEHHVVNSDNILLVILQWAWVSLFAFAGWITLKMFGVDKRVAVVEQAKIDSEKRRDEDEERRDKQRSELLDSIRENNTSVMGRLDSIDESLRNGYKSA